MYKIAAENLQALFRKIAADQDLYLPVRVSDQVNFKAWSQDADVCLDTLKTVKSPKDAFFPQSENLYTCKKEEKNISIEPQALQEKDFVVFGMKACDLQGVKVLDNVFLSDPIDTFYGEYQAGEDTASRGPLTNFTFDDVEPAIVAERG